MLDDGAKGECLESSDLRPDKRSVRREELARSREAGPLGRTSRERRLRQFNGQGIRIRIARHLAEDVVVATSGSEHDGRAELGLREVGEGERDENYASGCR
jgi:hypothetical protein